MKTNNKAYLITLILLVVFSFSCKEDEGSDSRTIQFEATFSTSRGNELVPCDDPISELSFFMLEHQVGDGTATELGEFSTEMTFCMHFVINEEGNVNPAGEGFGEYSGGEGEFTGENGDKIFFTIPEGLVQPTTEEGYVFEFQDKVIITGGTGDFAEATGELITESYVKPEGGALVTDHIWSGEITLE